MRYLYAKDFAEWRAQARTVLTQGYTPLEVTWGEEKQASLFEEALPSFPSRQELHVPKGFFPLAELVACHRSPKRWDLLYQLLFRLTHGEKNVMRILTDPLMHALLLMQKAVRRDAHKMKAFVRFKLVMEEGSEHYIAWHRPDHFVVPLVAPFFSRRFSTMVWTIMTPETTAHWDGEHLSYGPGLPESAAPKEDKLEDLWRDYYRATFNPARVKIKTMKREMPVRHWRTLPEAKIIGHMLAEVPERLQKMLEHTEGLSTSAEAYLPQERDLVHLRAAAKACEGCELYRDATQTVFGEGPQNAALMLIGEQPGDEEDKKGKPFIGPAGQLLQEALTQAGLQRDEVYITNAVKHFRFLYRDSFRQHRSPSRYHVEACKPWLHAEMQAIKPKAVLCLGNTAARALIGAGFTMKQGRGLWINGTPPLLATYHPASILRAEDGQQQQQKNYLFEDVAKAALILKA